MEIPIEDFFEDVLGKAQRGLGLSDRELASKAGVPTEDLKQAARGDFDEATVRALAPVLNLDADSLVALFQKAWRPEPVDLPGLAVFNTPWGNMRVNAFLTWIPGAEEAVIFDSGADASDIIAKVDELGLKVGAIFLTHTHGDHIADLDRLSASVGSPPIYVNRLERLSGASLIDEGCEISIGKLRINSLLTSGHSQGGTSFVVSGLSRPLVIVGDSLFAGSMGGAPSAYEEALDNNRRKILTLPDETVICPGHGPLSTVAEEKANNPFFPELK